MIAVFFQLTADPFAHRVVAAGKVIRVVGVETLHSLARTGNTVGWTRALVTLGNQRRTFGGVAVVCCLQPFGVHGRFGLVYSPGRFEMTNAFDEVFSGQPVQGRHGCAIFEKRGIHDDDRTIVRVTHDNLEGTARTAAELLGYRGDVGFAGYKFHCF